MLFFPWQKVIGANIYVFSISGVNPSIILEKKETIFLIGLNQEQDQKNNVDKAVISGLDPCGIPTTFTQNVINWICTHVTEGW